MEDRLINYVDSLFAGVSQTPTAYSVKSETLGRLTLKYRELVSQGKTEDEAYSIAVASLGDVGNILAAARGNAYQPDFDKAKAEKLRNRSAVITAVSVALYILCPVPCILIENSIGVVLLFVMVAVATGLIIFNAISKKSYVKNDPSMKYAYEKKRESGISKALTSALWAVIIAVYFILSFSSGAWYITWLVFLIGAALEGVLKAVLELAGKD